MGGTDDIENLVKLTIEEHAEAHRKLYEEHGKQQDYIAWQSLLGQMENEERQEKLSRIGGLNNMGKPKTDEHKAKIAETITGTVLAEDTKESISKSMKGNTNSQNHSSEEYKKKQSEAMKAAWKRKKQKAG